MTAQAPLAVCIAGPTATGKTELALQLAARWPVEIISVDSAMVYRGMDIGTAKPEPAILRRVPHHLVDIRDPWDAYSAGEFCRDARRLIEGIVAAGRVPLLVGGTMLYFRALQKGMARLPAADPDVRAALDAEAEAVGWAELHRELARVDPAAAARIDPADRQRIQRALEVYRLTGRTLSALQAGGGEPRRPLRFLSLALVPADRAGLHRRIESRLDAMFAQGLVEEVMRLRALPQMHAGRPAMRAVGYRQIWACLAGEFDLDEARRRALVATRRHAKRQITWLRAEPGFVPLDIPDPRLADRVERQLRAGAVFDAL